MKLEDKDRIMQNQLAAQAVNAGALVEEEKVFNKQNFKEEL